jgi:hypothetical protein
MISGSMNCKPITKVHMKFAWDSTLISSREGC